MEVILSADPAAYRPGAVLEGEVQWTFEERPSDLELTLSWSTEGSFGGGDAPVVVRQESIKPSARDGKRAFRFDLPSGPWSFQGKLFSVIWTVELSAGEDLRSRAEFVLGPGGRAIPVGEGPAPEPGAGPDAAS